MHQPIQTITERFGHLLSLRFGGGSHAIDGRVALVSEAA